jgi:hypothetical protein
MLIERFRRRVRPPRDHRGSQDAIIVLVHRNLSPASVDLARAGDQDLALVMRTCGENVFGATAVHLDRAERVRDDVCNTDRGSEVEDAVAAVGERFDECFIEDGAFDDAYRVTLGVVSDIAAPAGGEIVENGHVIALVHQAIDKVAADKAGAASHQRPHVMAP